MIELTVKIDTIKLGDKIANKLDRTIEESELLELFMSKMSYEEKREFSDLLNQSVHAVVCHFDELTGVVS